MTVPGCPGDRDGHLCWLAVRSRKLGLGSVGSGRWRCWRSTCTPVHVCPGTSVQMDLPLSFPVQTGSRLAAICCPWEVGLRAEAWLLSALQWGTCL